MPIRVPWDKFEVALLIQAYEQCENGEDLSQTADELSKTLRSLATQRGIIIDDTYRNVNGMIMQLGNVQYLFSEGKKGLSGASTLIRQMVALYQSKPAEFQQILEEAIRLTGKPMSVEDAFFAYAKERTGLPPRMLTEYLQKASEYCHLHQSILGMTDVRAVRDAQQKVANGKLLRFRYGKDAQRIREITQLYYNFVKTYKPSKVEPITTPAPDEKDESALSHNTPTAHQPEANLPAQDTVFTSSTDSSTLSVLHSPQQPYITNQGLAVQEKVIEESTEEDASEGTEEEWLIHELRVRNIPYVDNRPADGCLWIASDLSFPIAMSEVESHGYKLRFKQDGCRMFPDRPVLWTKDIPGQVRSVKPTKKVAATAEFRKWLETDFRAFLTNEKHLAAGTVTQYCQSIEAVEQFLIENEIALTLIGVTAKEAETVFATLAVRIDFTAWNNQRHHQYSAALRNYIEFINGSKSDSSKATPGSKAKPSPKTTAATTRSASQRMTVVEAVKTVLESSSKPLSAAEVLARIQAQNLYAFNTAYPVMVVHHALRIACKGVDAPDHAKEDLFGRVADESGKYRYYLLKQEISTEPKSPVAPGPSQVSSGDSRWSKVLTDSFPDGYIMDDFLSQFQASAYWQECYGETCPLEGSAIDDAIKACGMVRDGRVFPRNDEDRKLILGICEEINEILSNYTNAYRSCIYSRYQEQLAACAIYTEAVMTQQLLQASGGSFISTYQVFAKPGRETSVIEDCRKVLRDHGGAMSVDDVAKVLWFIPRDIVYHSLSVDKEALNIDTGIWMLAEHFPLTKEDADQIAAALDDYLQTQDFIHHVDIMPFLQSRLPSIADNLSGLYFKAVFNILYYYLKDRFSFSNAIISPKGAKLDFTVLFRTFAREHEQFTLDELSAYASELKVPIYWNSTFAAGAVRISRTEFVHRRKIAFDVESTDKVLESFCTGDYLPLEAVSSAMMMHLPPCGYRWNGYLLLSYVLSFSKVFQFFCNSLGKSGHYGAMVRRSCKSIGSYEQLIERVLTDDDSWETESDALALLVNQGYQARQRFNGIEKIVARAKQNKLAADGK